MECNYVYKLQWISIVPWDSEHEWFIKIKSIARYDKDMKTHTSIPLSEWIKVIQDYVIDPMYVYEHKNETRLF